MQPQFTMQVLRAAFGCMEMCTEAEASSLCPVHKKIRKVMMQDPIVMSIRKRIHKLAQGGAGSSTDPPQPPYPPQPDLPPILTLAMSTRLEDAT